jgi:hypothetical protein
MKGTESLTFPYDNNPIQGFFSGKRGAGTHKRGKEKHAESFVIIS